MHKVENSNRKSIYLGKVTLEAENHNIFGAKFPP